MLKIVILGGGLSGISLARLLTDKGHDITILEKENVVGGLCRTETHDNGIMFEPFGAHTFHTKKKHVMNFALRFDEFNDYKHRKGMLIDGRLFPFPLTVKSIERLKNSDKISKELRKRPKEINKHNFETACLSIFGRTLYELHIANYSKKMWGMEPKELTAEWAPKRLELRNSNNDELFEKEMQGLPVHGFSYWLEKMAEGIKIHKNICFKCFDKNDFDLVISTIPIDELMGYKFGKLPYRSLRMEYAHDEVWEKQEYGTINLPQHERFIRKCNFKVLHQQENEYNLIQYQEPMEANEYNVPMYPINTKKNEELFDKYLQEVCKENIIPLGRLAMFKYLNMDDAISMAMDISKIIEDYLKMDTFQRYKEINIIRNKY